MKLTIYTAVFGGYEQSLPNVKFKGNTELTRWCYTDNPGIKNDKGWNVVHVPGYFYDPKLSVLYFKCNPHIMFQDATYVIWVDANIAELNLDEQLINSTIGKSCIATSVHGFWNTIKEEVKEIVSRGWENKAKSERQLAKLADLHLLDIKKLSCNFTVWRNLSDYRVRLVNETWWRMILDGSRRDMFSHDSAMKSHGVVPGDLPFHIRTSNNVIRINQHPLDKKGKAIKNTYKYILNSSVELPGCNYPNVVVPEQWLSSELNAIRKLTNDLRGLPDHECLSQVVYSAYSKPSENIPPDPRLSYKREFIRRSSTGRSRIVQAGLNDGYSASLILSQSYSSTLKAFDIFEGMLSDACSSSLSSLFKNRFVRVKDEKGNQDCDMVYVEIPANADKNHERITDIVGWYLCFCPDNCLLLFSFANEPRNKVLLKTLENTNELKEIYPGMLSNNECRLFSKTA